MSHETLITASTAADICQQVALEAEAVALLWDDLTPQQFLDLLMAQHHFPDATRFLARALPKRAAVWWACLCVRTVSGRDTRPEDMAALQAAERWVHEPSEHNRRATMAAAEATGFRTPASWAAVAAFWSEGSLAPPDVPAVPAGDSLSAQAVTGAVMLAAVLSEPEKAPEKYATFLAQGRALGDGWQSQ